MITLKKAMRVNAAICMIFALIFLLNPASIAAFLSGENHAPDLAFLILAAILIFNGLHLIWISSNPMPNKLWILYFSFGDLLWVVATIVLLVIGIWITTEVGIIASILVAIVVGTLGVLQMIKRKEMGNC